MKLSSSYICLNEVRFHARHGVMPQERDTGGDFIVTLRAKYDFTKALGSDNVEDTLNYADIFGIINKVMQEPSCLIEHVAGRIGECIFKAMPDIESLDITLKKLNPPIGADLDSAAVELHLINDKTF